MTTTRIILVSFMVDTVQNMTGNRQLPVSTSLGGGGENECKPHPYKAIICTLKGLLKCSAPVTSIEEFPPKVLVTIGTITITKMIESQIEWVCFKFKLSQKWKHFLRSHSEKEVTQ